MFFNKKSSREQQKEIRLTVIQLDKTIQRVLENADNAIAAFDKSFEHLFKISSESQDEFSRTTLYLNEVMLVYRLLNQNEEFLKHIKSLTDKKYLHAPSLIKESVQIIQNKNDGIVFALRARRDVVKEDGDVGKPENSIARMVVSKNDTLADLLQLRDAIRDLQELVRMQFLVTSSDYVHESRLEELRNIQVDNFDFVKLIRLCEELNSAYQNENYLSVIVLVRAILDHVPPIFGHKYFVDVASQYGGKSLKKSLQNLQNSSRNIADAYLHEPVRSQESLPNETQIDFRNDLDVLLGEIIRVLK